jgi:hypothetical protein
VVNDTGSLLTSVLPPDNHSKTAGEREGHREHQEDAVEVAPRDVGGSLI